MEFDSVKLCECGCGKAAPISRETDPKRGRVKGQPFRFCQGHALRGRFAEANNSWTGGRVRANGYILIHQPSHPRAQRGYVLEHLLVAEKALGRLIPFCVEVHHVNETKDDNSNRNLVICEDLNYHRLLHARKRAYEACGDPNAHKCKYCKKWDRESLIDGSSFYHRPCKTIYDKQRVRNKEVSNGI